jgi:aminopeptidase N
MLEVLGRRFGEYPFFADKLWVVQTPYLGMEHQTLVAYGGDLSPSKLGFDPLLLHELAHEWWGNKVSVRDWADIWIHESFATYSEAIYVNDTEGLEAYLAYMQRLRPKIENDAPLVQGTDLPGSVAYTNDTYFKGAWVLHTLRYLIGDEAFFGTLEDLMTDPHLAYGFISTRDVLEAFAKRSGIQLDWFWSRYLYRSELPGWTLEQASEGPGVRVVVRWDDPYFLMPVPVRIGEKTERLPIVNHRASVLIDPNATLEVDPDGWILSAGPAATGPSDTDAGTDTGGR